jgi:hypothetical protein
LNENPVLDREDAIEKRDHVNVMGSDQDGRSAIVGRFAQELEDCSTALGIHMGRRLIRDDKPGFSDESSDERDALLLTGRELGRSFLAFAVQVDASEPRLAVAAGLSKRHACQDELHRGILHGGVSGHEVVGVDQCPYVLEAEVGRCIGRERREVRAVEDDAAALWDEQSAREAQERRLPGPAGSIHGCDLAGLDLERDSFDSADGLSVNLVMSNDVAKLQAHDPLSRCGSS